MKNFVKCCWWLILLLLVLFALGLTFIFCAVFCEVPTTAKVISVLIGIASDCGAVTLFISLLNGWRDCIAVEKLINEELNNNKDE